ncbi:hypothetical protein HG537_0F00270 [Torulaspora globosa]|uniref:Cell division control protein 50 n=1 Tax=Torulaspora globosa TaxID=48254 RepID=A0A7H9HWG9_9SACH|nr:hypothetical protein HG537_0F00270 [Torulaspora sp. CBS 2947]
MVLFFRRRKVSLTDSDTGEPVKKSRKPPNTAFRQQRLKAWQPILSPQSVLPLLIFVACIFAPIGIGLIVSATNVQDLVIDYSKCETDASGQDFSEIPSKFVHYHFKRPVTTKPQWKLDESDSSSSICEIRFQVPNRIRHPVYLYYKLTNFYQNHRKYVESVDIQQLKGEAIDADSLNSNCNPLRKSGGKAVYPCGLIANSMFNDTFSTVLEGSDGTEDFQLTNKGIAWAIDRHRFKKTSYNASQIVPPPNWAKRYPEGYTDDNIPDISSWEELQVWMRTAALPKFYKLALKSETGELLNGTYTIKIGLNFPVSSFGGSKSIVLTTSSIIGGRNISLGVLYCIVAGISALFAIIFLVKVIIQPRTMGDHSYLNFDSNVESHVEQQSNNNVPLREIL